MSLHGSALSSAPSSLLPAGGGGLHSNLSSCEKFDVRLQCWQRVAALNVSRHALAVTSFGSSVYAVGMYHSIVPVLELLLSRYTTLSLVLMLIVCMTD